MKSVPVNPWIWAICWASKGISCGSHHLNGGSFSAAGGSTVLRWAGGADCHRSQYAPHAVGWEKQGAPCPGGTSVSWGCNPLPACVGGVCAPPYHQCVRDELYLLWRCAKHLGAWGGTGLCHCQSAGFHLAGPLGGLYKPRLWTVLAALAGFASRSADCGRCLPPFVACAGREEKECPVNSCVSF